jgi:hypothetical membrane protein
MQKKNGLFFYYLIILIIATILIIITANLFERPFTFHDVCISNLGNPTSNYNPKAFWLFSITCIFGSIALIPIYKQIYIILLPEQPQVSRIWLFLLIIATIGLSGVGIFNEHMGPIHYVFAILAFGGYGLAILLFGGMMIHRTMIKAPWSSVRSWVILYLILILLMVFMISEVIRLGIDNPADLNFVEWVAFFTVAIWFGGLTLLKESKLFRK